MNTSLQKKRQNNPVKLQFWTLIFSISVFQFHLTDEIENLNESFLDKISNAKNMVQKHPIREGFAPLTSWIRGFEQSLLRYQQT